MKFQNVTLHCVFKIEITPEDQKNIQEIYGHSWMSGDLTEYALKYKKDQFQKDPIALFQESDEAWYMAREKADALLFSLDENNQIREEVIFVAIPVEFKIAREPFKLCYPVYQIDLSNYKNIEKIKDLDKFVEKEGLLKEENLIALFESKDKAKCYCESFDYPDQNNPVYVTFSYKRS